MSTEPALLADGSVLAAGKSRIAYLLDGSHLGGIGGQQAIARGRSATSDIDGGSATVGTTVYLPCLSGIVAVRVGGLTGLAPICCGARARAVARRSWPRGLVWTIGQDGTLYGLDPTTGATRQQASIGVPANHFPTPERGDGLLLAPSADQVVAFAASSTGAPTTTRPPEPVTTVPSRPAGAPTVRSRPGRPRRRSPPWVGGLAAIGRDRLAGLAAPAAPDRLSRQSAAR